MTKEQLEGDLRFNELTNEEDNRQTQELSCVVVRERERESSQMHKHHCQSQMNPHTCQQQELGLYKTHVIILSLACHNNTIMQTLLYCLLLLTRTRTKQHDTQQYSCDNSDGKQI
jgi:hypothetical protein